MRMFSQDFGPLPHRVKVALKHLSTQIGQLERDQIFQDSFYDIDESTRNGRSFHQIVFEDLMNAFIYGHQASPDRLVHPEICRTLMEYKTGLAADTKKAVKHCLKERLLYEAYVPDADDPEYLHLFKDAPLGDLAHISPLLIKLADTWSDAALAIADATDNESFKSNVLEYIGYADAAVLFFKGQTAPAPAVSTTKDDQTSPSTALAVQEEKPPFKKDVLNKLIARARDKALPAQVLEDLTKDLKALDDMPESASDFSKNLQPLVTLVNMPWHDKAPLPDMQQAEARLHEKHAGLEDVKEIIFEYLSVHKRTGKPGGTILCLDGAPGVGKTSLANAVAYALGRPIVRISLGGLNDAHEIRGHRSTYIGAKPGRIVNGLLRAGVRNPVILLDEIDKINHTQNNVEAAMLDLLDPEQNVHFTDSYIDTPFDLSDVLFIATSNNRFNIMPALRDRMEVISLPAYTPDEKLRIAQSHLLPRHRQSCNLTEEEFSFSTEVLQDITTNYIHEAGVRRLDRAIGKIARHAAYQLESGQATRVEVTSDDLKDILGKPSARKETITDRDAVGIVHGLYVGGVTGGGLLPFEVVKIPNKSPVLTLKGTGQLREVMKESLDVVTTWLRSKSEGPVMDNKDIEKFQLHVDAVNDGPKDGPSAGAAIAAACVSALLDKPLRHDTALTGKLSVSGQVLAIGGVSQKLEGALRNGMKRVLIPEANRDDLDDVRAEVKAQLEIIPVRTMDEVLSNLFAAAAQNKPDNATDAPAPASGTPEGTPDNTPANDNEPAIATVKPQKLTP